jgi:hypothetical protein
LSAPRITILSASFGNGRCRLGLIPWRAHPNVAHLVGREDHRHSFGMDWRDDGIRRNRQEAID